MPVKTARSSPVSRAVCERYVPVVVRLSVALRSCPPTIRSMASRTRVEQLSR
jgi:hypothetical protein